MVAAAAAQLPGKTRCSTPSCYSVCIPYHQAGSTSERCCCAHAQASRLWLLWSFVNYSRSRWFQCIRERTARTRQVHSPFLPLLLLFLPPPPQPATTSFCRSLAAHPHRFSAVMRAAILQVHSHAPVPNLRGGQPQVPLLEEKGDHAQPPDIWQQR